MFKDIAKLWIVVACCFTGTLQAGERNRWKLRVDTSKNVLLRVFHSELLSILGTDCSANAHRYQNMVKLVELENNVFDPFITMSQKRYEKIQSHYLRDSSQIGILAGVALGLLGTGLHTIYQLKQTGEIVPLLKQVKIGTGLGTTTFTLSTLLLYRSLRLERLSKAAITDTYIYDRARTISKSPQAVVEHGTDCSSIIVVRSPALLDIIKKDKSLFVQDAGGFEVDRTQQQ